MEPNPRSQKLRGKPTPNKAIPQFLAGAGEAKELLDLLFGGGVSFLGQLDSSLWWVIGGSPP